MTFSPTLLDVYDASGNPTGVQKWYDDVHRDGDWHKGVHVWLITEQGELLLQRRSLGLHTYPGLWENSAGGHIDAGYTSIQTAQKELQEEVGIALPLEKFELLFTVIDQFTSDTHQGHCINNEFDDVYLVVVPERVTTKMYEKEVSEICWVDFRELEQKLHSGSLGYIPRPIEYSHLFNVLHARFDTVLK